MSSQVRGRYDSGDLYFEDKSGNELCRMSASTNSFGHRTSLEAHTASDTLTVAESGSHHTNLGAAGAVTLSLPQDATAGVHYYFTVQVAQELRLDPGAAGAVYLLAGKQVDDKYVTANAIGESIMVTCDGNGDWVGSFETGTWTAEA